MTDLTVFFWEYFGLVGVVGKALPAVGDLNGCFDLQIKPVTRQKSEQLNYLITETMRLNRRLGSKTMREAAPEQQSSHTI